MQHCLKTSQVKAARTSHQHLSNLSRRGISHIRRRILSPESGTLELLENQNKETANLPRVVPGAVDPTSLDFLSDFRDTFSASFSRISTSLTNFVDRVGMVLNNSIDAKAGPSRGRGRNAATSSIAWGK